MFVQGSHPGISRLLGNITYVIGFLLSPKSPYLSLRSNNIDMFFPPFIFFNFWNLMLYFPIHRMKTRTGRRRRGREGNVSTPSSTAAWWEPCWPCVSPWSSVPASLPTRTSTTPWWRSGTRTLTKTNKVELLGKNCNWNIKHLYSFTFCVPKILQQYWANVFFFFCKLI